MTLNVQRHTNEEKETTIKLNFTLLARFAKSNHIGIAIEDKIERQNDNRKANEKNGEVK